MRKQSDTETNFIGLFFMVLFVKLKIVLNFSIFRSTSENDIAVIKVTPPIIFNDKVQKVTLPDPSFETKGRFTNAHE